MKKEVSKKKKVTVAILCSVIIFVAIVLIGAISSGDTETPNTTTKATKTTEATTTAQQKEENENVIYIDKNFKITYVDFIDPKAGVTAFNLLLKIENNSDKNVIASLTDGYANDTAVTFLTGLPVKIKAGKNAAGSFAFGYANTGITSIEEINTLEFKVVLYDENYSEKILETNDIVLDIK